MPPSDEAKLKLLKNSVIIEATWTKALAFCLILLSASTGFAMWLAPKVSDTHNDTRYVQISAAKDDKAQLQRDIDRNADMEREARKELSSKVDSVQTDIKEILRFLRNPR